MTRTLPFGFVALVVLLLSFESKVATACDVTEVVLTGRLNSSSPYGTQPHVATLSSMSLEDLIAQSDHAEVVTVVDDSQNHYTYRIFFARATLDTWIASIYSQSDPYMDSLVTLKPLALLTIALNEHGYQLERESLFLAFTHDPKGDVKGLRIIFDGFSQIQTATSASAVIVSPVVEPGRCPSMTEDTENWATGGIKNELTDGLRNVPGGYLFEPNT